MRQLRGVDGDEFAAGDRHRVAAGHGVGVDHGALQLLDFGRFLFFSRRFSRWHFFFGRRFGDRFRFERFFEGGFERFRFGQRRLRFRFGGRAFVVGGFERFRRFFFGGRDGDDAAGVVGEGPRRPGADRHPKEEAEAEGHRAQRRRPAAVGDDQGEGAQNAFAAVPEALGVGTQAPQALHR